jgi:hypothetical protein
MIAKHRVISVLLSSFWELQAFRLYSDVTSFEVLVEKVVKFLKKLFCYLLGFCVFVCVCLIVYWNMLALKVHAKVLPLNLRHVKTNSGWSSVTWVQGTSVSSVWSWLHIIINRYWNVLTKKICFLTILLVCNFHLLPFLCMVLMVVCLYFLHEVTNLLMNHLKSLFFTFTQGSNFFKNRNQNT